MNIRRSIAVFACLACLMCADFAQADDFEEILTKAWDGSAYSTYGRIYYNFGAQFLLGRAAGDEDPVMTFQALTNTGIITWMEDEDYFRFSDDILLIAAENIYFRDTAISIASLTAGYLDITSTTATRFNAATADTDIPLWFVGTSSTGVGTWMEDEDYFLWSDDFLMASGEKIHFVNTGAYIQATVSTVLDLFSGGTIRFGATSADTDITMQFDGTSNSGEFLWLEDEDYFQFRDEILMNSARRIYFRDTDITIASPLDGNLDLTADIRINMNAPVLATDKILFTQTDGNEYIDSGGDGYLDMDATTKIRIHGVILARDKIEFTQTDGDEYIDSLSNGYLDLEATTGIRLRIGGTGEAILTSTALRPITDDDIDLGASGIQWKDLFIDGKAEIDEADIGDGTNESRWSTDGTLTLAGTARVLKQIPVANANLGKGSTAPSQVILGNYNAWEFTINDDAVFTFHIPHGWAIGTDIDVHIDWYIDEAGGDEIKWQIAWSATPHDSTEAIDAPTHTGSSDTGDIIVPATVKFLTSNSISIAGASLAAEDQVGITLSRIAITDGVNPGNDPAVVDVHIEYTADKLGEDIT